MILKKNKSKNKQKQSTEARRQKAVPGLLFSEVECGFFYDFYFLLPESKNYIRCTDCISLLYSIFFFHSKSLEKKTEITSYFFKLICKGEWWESIMFSPPPNQDLPSTQCLYKCKNKNTLLLTKAIPYPFRKNKNKPINSPQDKT